VRKRVVKRPFTVDCNPNHALLILCVLLLQLNSPDKAFRIEFENLRDAKDKVLEFVIDQLMVDSDELIQKLFVDYEERHHRFELRVVRRSPANVQLQQLLCIIQLFFFLLVRLLLTDFECRNHLLVAYLTLWLFYNLRLLLKKVLEAEFR